ncbi:MAG: RimK family alpha-L-glutamate ligase [Saprospirales bacterium]|nr:MAG: RimK family alpha-L-glutamate ligase [Saprospirales bacterium]
MNQKLKIVILSRGPSLYSTRSLLRAGRERGHHISVMDHMNCDLVIDSKKPQVWYYGRNCSDIDAVIPRIGASVTAHGAAVIRQFELMNCFTTLNSEALLLTRNKLSCLQVLSGNGIDIPKTILPSTRSMAYRFLDQLKRPPYVIKVVSGTHGSGVLKADSKTSALHLLDTFSQLREMVIAQEYIEESSGKDLRIIVVGDRVVAAMERKSNTGDFRSNLHLGGSASLIKISDEERDIAIKSVHLMGLKVAGVDMLRSHRGPLVLEVNASPGLEGIEKTTGVDIAAHIIALAENHQNVSHE